MYEHVRGFFLTFATGHPKITTDNFKMLINYVIKHQNTGCGSQEGVFKTCTLLI